MRLKKVREEEVKSWKIILKCFPHINIGKRINIYVPTERIRRILISLSTNITRII